MGKPEAFVLYKGKLESCDTAIIDGRKVTTNGKPMFWPMGHRDVRARTEPVRAILLHHTAGENPGAGIFRTLVKRKLSVHFTIDAEGTIIQHADVDHVTEHGGAANGYTVGIEIENRGVPPNFPHDNRKVYAHMMHRRNREFLAFYPRQVLATYSLCKSLCSLLSLPFDFPYDERGYTRYETLDPKSLAAFSGILGHFHVERRKIDPSPHLFHDMVKLRSMGQ
jgi:N-acetyl-anhydromuramyl-L-alanine amidase AmpD